MKNINNFRNVKGYINKDNKKLKANMIFRGGALNRLIPDEINYFEKTKYTICTGFQRSK